MVISDDSDFDDFEDSEEPDLVSGRSPKLYSSTYTLDATEW